MRNEQGRFTREREQPWIGAPWDDGYVDNHGRFRVYRPDYPRAYAEGYALRAHVVWWLLHGEPHPKGTNIHHRNGIKLDDKYANLAVISHGEHSRRHNTDSVFLPCQTCGMGFRANHWRIKQRGAKYCSQKCFHARRGDA